MLRPRWWCLQCLLRAGEQPSCYMQCTPRRFPQPSLVRSALRSAAGTVPYCSGGARSAARDRPALRRRPPPPMYSSRQRSQAEPRTRTGCGANQTQVRSPPVAPIAAARAQRMRARLLNGSPAPGAAVRRAGNTLQNRIVSSPAPAPQRWLSRACRRATARPLRAELSAASQPRGVHTARRPQSCTWGHGPGRGSGEGWARAGTPTAARVHPRQ